MPNFFERRIINKRGVQSPEKAPASESFTVEGGSVASEKHPERNEDMFFFDKASRSFGVFDGIGGYAGGENASRSAAQYIGNSLSTIPQGLEVEDIKKLIRETIFDANEMILKKARSGYEKNMGTTASIGYIHEDKSGRKKLIIANVGDSRVYLQRGGRLYQITVDDNIVSLSYRDEKQARYYQSRLNNSVNPQFELSSQEYEMFHSRNQITQYLGAESIEPRIYEVDVFPGDKILTVSDGISDNLTDREMEAILAGSKTVREAVPELIKAAYEISKKGLPRSKADDMTAVVMSISEAADSAREDTSTKESLQNNNTKRDFRIGDAVNVRRSSGKIEGGWRVSGFNLETGTLIVTKSQENGKVIKKELDPKELKNYN